MNLFGWCEGFVMLEIDEGKRKYFEYVPWLPLFYNELPVSYRSLEIVVSWPFYKEKPRPNNVLNVDYVYDEYLMKSVFAILDRMKLHHPRMYYDFHIHWNEEFGRAERFSRIDLLSDLNDEELLNAVSFCKDVYSGGGYDSVVYRDESFFMREFVAGCKSDPFEDVDDDVFWEQFKADEYDYGADFLELFSEEWTDDVDEVEDEDEYDEEETEDCEIEDYDDIDDFEDDDDDDLDDEIEEKVVDPELYHRETTYSEFIAFMIVSLAGLAIGVFFL